MKKTMIIILLIAIYSISGFSQFGTDTMSKCISRAYLELSSWDMYGVKHWGIGSCSSDNSEGGGGGMYDLAQMQQLNIFEGTEENIELREYWYRAYNIIYFCNLAIHLSDQTDLDNLIKERYIAEAKFIRSLMYFELSITLGKAVLLTDIFNWELTNDFFPDYNITFMLNKDFSNISEIFNQIELDLNEVVSDLPQKSSLGNDELFRATKGAAYGLLAKTLLFGSSYARYYTDDERFTGLTEKWDQVKNVALSVINSNEYELVGINGEAYNTWWDGSYLYPDETPGFRYIFSVDGNDSPESVFSVGDRREDKNQWIPNGGNSIVNMTGPRGIIHPDTETSIDYGWGWIVPTVDLKNAFAEESGNANDDPRFSVTVALETDSLLAYIYDAYT
ncbi:RagB/SusD family nutrient uptake outer membrane protein [Bacteroidota bacterium]